MSIVGSRQISRHLDLAWRHVLHWLLRGQRIPVSVKVKVKAKVKAKAKAKRPFIRRGVNALFALQQLRPGKRLAGMKTRNWMRD